MKNSKKEIATQRILILFDNAVSNARNNPKLAERQAQIARKISMRFKIKMPWQIRISFCKKCKKFIVPSIFNGEDWEKQCKIYTYHLWVL